VLFAAHFINLADGQFSLIWRGVSLLFKTRTTHGRVLKRMAFEQGQLRIKRGFCLALLGALELL
jgi:hypothetical protein